VFQLLAGHLLDESTLSQCLHSVGKLVGACDGGVVSNGACDGGVIYHEYASMQP
jgi:CRISPR/Cas system-associated endonuclease Cas3-HD